MDVDGTDASWSRGLGFAAASPRSRAGRPDAVVVVPERAKGASHRYSNRFFKRDGADQVMAVREVRQ
jgi:hypothetical protein